MFLQEALQREQLLENKLAALQRLVETTRQASDLGWKALIDEDRLLSRVEILENQLQMYSKVRLMYTSRPLSFDYMVHCLKVHISER